MAEQRSTKTTRTEARRAAMQLLQKRAALIGEASGSKDALDEAAAALATARARYQADLDACRAAGWLPEELAQLGLVPPAVGPRRRADRAHHSSAGTAAVGDASEPDPAPAVDELVVDPAGSTWR